MNYIMFNTDDVLGQHAVLNMAHFKNEASKGVRKIPLVKELIEPLIMQHKARQAVAPDCPTLFFSKSFIQMPLEYFITRCGDALTIPDRERVTAGTFRSLFQTMYKNFLHQLGFKLLDVVKEEIEKAAAEGMLSGIHAVERFYDRGDVDRTFFVVQPFWEMFKEFVKTDHTSMVSRKAWNFFEELPNIEGLTLNALS